MSADFLAGVLSTLAARWGWRRIRRLSRRVARAFRRPEPAPCLWPSLNDPANWPKRRRKAR